MISCTVAIVDNTFEVDGTLWYPIASVPVDTRVIVYHPGHPKGKDHEIRTALFPRDYPLGNVPCTHWTHLPKLPNGNEIVRVLVRRAGVLT